MPSDSFQDFRLSFLTAFGILVIVARFLAKTARNDIGAKVPRKIIHLMKIEVNMIQVLFLAADPKNVDRLRLGEEAREIEEKLRFSRKKIKFTHKTAVRTADLSQAMLDVKPTIVHFSGHGTPDGAICLENKIGEAHPVSPESLAVLFELFKEEVQCVILNACYSETQANAIAHHIPNVIGMSNMIRDDAAIAFSIGFYQGIGAGKSIEASYQLGCAQIKMEGIAENEIPVLIRKSDLEPSALGSSVAEDVETTEGLGIELKPFGEVECEVEVKLLKGKYPDYYFTKTRFSKLAIEKGNYLIIGRRGSGKTALCEYFKFQNEIPNALAIDVDEQIAFKAVRDRVLDITEPRELSLPELSRVWGRIIWSLIFCELREKDKRISQACPVDSPELPFVDPAQSIASNLLGIKERDKIFEEAKNAVFEFTRKRPVIIAVDTLENIDFEDETMMKAMASLIQCASDFNRNYSSRNIYLKVFVMAEVFPHLKEAVALNPLKSIRNEVYMHWRPKDLMRLICWRFYQYLKACGLPEGNDIDIDWQSHRDVEENMWMPFFGKEIENALGLAERTFPYVLRHTQMRPRQLILLCDRIAEKAKAGQRFPRFSAIDLVNGIREAETDLAEEVLNSYNTVYPQVGKILDALAGLGKTFKGQDLDKRAYQTISLWPEGRYSPANFRQLVSELGIVGRIRSRDEKTKIIAADFEYSSTGRLGLLASDDCAIHPMFYSKFRIQKQDKWMIYPFPDHPEFIEVLNGYNA